MQIQIKISDLSIKRNMTDDEKIKFLRNLEKALATLGLKPEILLIEGAMLIPKGTDLSVAEQALGIN